MAQFLPHTRKFVTNMILNRGNKSFNPKVYGMEGRLASALFSAASKFNALEKVFNDLTKFEEMLSKDPLMKKFINDPFTRTPKRMEFIEEVFKPFDLSPITKHFLEELSDRNKLNHSLNVINSYKILMKSFNDQVNCLVVTSERLDDNERARFESYISKLAKPNQKVNLMFGVDPRVKGVQAKLGEKKLDLNLLKSSEEENEQQKS